MKKMVKTTKAPAAIGAYSQAIYCDDLLYISGQLPICPITNALEIDDIKKATITIMSNIEKILEECSMNFQDVIKSTIYLKNISDFTKVNEGYKMFFTDDYYPARACIGVADLPKGATIEIEIIAKK